MKKNVSTLILFITLLLTSTSVISQGDLDIGDILKAKVDALSPDVKELFTRAYGLHYDKIEWTYGEPTLATTLKNFEYAIETGKGKKVIPAKLLSEIKKKIPGKTIDARKKRFIEIVKRMESETEDE